MQFDQMQPIEHLSIKENIRNQNLETSLIDCLKMFKEQEYISHREGLRCERCVEPTNHIR